jgi:hypothetical protein
MKRRYEVWVSGEESTLATPESIVERKSQGLLNPEATLRYVIEANTWEEASAIYHLRSGFGPYQPLGLAAPCPQCAALCYPEGSGQCWQCGREP